VTASPTYDLRIEPDGGIAIHDWRPELRRQFWRRSLIFVGLAAVVALALWGGWLGLQDDLAGIQYTPGRRGRRDFEPHTIVAPAASMRSGSCLARSPSCTACCMPRPT
jgi:hypothetical protein